MIDEDVVQFLEHHGVKGMRWGVRNKPERLSGRSNGNVGELTPNQVTLSIYGGIAAVAILAKFGKHVFDSGIRDARRSKNIPFKLKPSLKGKKSIDQLHKDVATPINPGFGASGTKMNCRRATLAYEMRRRGYDVKATKSSYATGQNTRGLRKVIDTDKKAKFQSPWGETTVSNVLVNVKVPKDQRKAAGIYNSLSKYPNGARGELGMAWIMGGGHSMAFEIVNKKPVIFDTQSNKVYRTPKDFAPFANTISIAAHTRLDNKPIDEDRIRRWVTNV